MEEAKKANGEISNDIICISHKHWSSYVIPGLIVILGILLLLSGLFSSETIINGWTIFGLVLSLIFLNKILANMSTKWILTKEDLIIKSGFLPWKKSYFEIPVEDIFEAYYQYGFWAKLLGFAHLNIRRTEGSTSQFMTTKMTNFEQMTQTINSEVRNLKKLANQVNKLSGNNNFSVSDELLKLNELLEKSIISEEEFKAQKDRLLNSN